MAEITIALGDIDAVAESLFIELRDMTTIVIAKTATSYAIKFNPCEYPKVEHILKFGKFIEIMKAAPADLRAPIEEFCLQEIKSTLMTVRDNPEIVPAQCREHLKDSGLAIYLWQTLKSAMANTQCTNAQHAVAGLALGIWDILTGLPFMEAICSQAIISTKTT
jgi:hypothetical protein